MEFIQENKKMILIILAIVAVLIVAHRMGYLKLKSEGYQGNDTLYGRGLEGRGIVGDRLTPICPYTAENN